MLKWKLMLQTAPYVVGALVVKLVLDQGFGYSGSLEFSDVGPVLTGGVFLIGFMLAGTMADYKESEKLPGEVACILEAIEEILAQAAISKPSIQARPLRQALLEMTDQVHAWLFRKISHPEIYAALGRFGELFQQLEKDGAASHASRGLQELHNLRRSITRIGVISRTGFLASGYALLEALTVVILAALMATRFKTVLSECVMVSFITLIYVYMLGLIKDIDDPFEYSPQGRMGAAEIELFPIEEYRERLQARLSAPGAADPASAAKAAG